MSNRNKWVKSLKFKHIVRVEQTFKSYWIRKFLNKISIVSKLHKSEIFLNRLLLHFKKLQLKKKHRIFTCNKKRYIGVPATAYSRNKQPAGYASIFKNMSFFCYRSKYHVTPRNYNIGSFVHSLIFKYKSYLYYKSNFSYAPFNFLIFFKKRCISSIPKTYYFKFFKFFSSTKDFESFFKKCKIQRFIFGFIKKKKKKISRAIKRKHILGVANQDIYKPLSLPYWRASKVPKKIKKCIVLLKNKKFRKINMYRIKRKPISFLFRVIDSIRWVFTTQLKRMGKFFHSIPTMITFPRNINFGLKVLSRVLNRSDRFYSFFDRLKFETLCILSKPRKSISMSIRKARLRISQKNIPYSHYRWK